MAESWARQLELLPDYLSQHLLLTLVALGAGLVISLPTAILITRVRILRGPVLAIASVFQTVPSIAMLALMVPLLRQIGFLPAAIALTLYSMLPVIRNTVTGIEEVDANLVEAAKGLGMTPNQILRKVQLPLALPVIIAGIRTATVWVVGIATLSTPVGATSLGNYIFSGLQTQNYAAVWMGCLSAAALALVLDGLIRVMEVASKKRRPGLVLIAILAVVVVIGFGLSPALIGEPGDESRTKITIGAKTFTEQYILAQVIADTVDDAGYAAESLQSLGSTVVFDALTSGRIDAYVDYTGTIWANYMNRSDIPGADDVLQGVTAWLRNEHGVTCLGRLGFENAYCLAMSRERAERLGIESIDDLAPHAAGMEIGGDYEFFGRPEWADLAAAYGLEFGNARSMDSTLMYSAVEAGEVHVISAFSTDGRIAAFDLLVLEDPKDAFPPYDAVILLSEHAAEDQTLRDALRPLLNSIDDAVMRKANKLVDVDGQPVEAAARWLEGQFEED